MPKKYDLAVRTGTYTNSHGEEKSRWKNVGSIHEGENGPFMLLDATFNPAGIEREPGRDSIFVSLFEPKEPASGEQRRPEPNDDIPF